MWEHGQGLGNVGENLAQPGSAAVEALSCSPSSAGSLCRIKCACDDQQLPCTVAHLAGEPRLAQGAAWGMLSIAVSIPITPARVQPSWRFCPQRLFTSADGASVGTRNFFCAQLSGQLHRRRASCLKLEACSLKAMSPAAETMHAFNASVLGLSMAVQQRLRVLPPWPA